MDMNTLTNTENVADSSNAKDVAKALRIFQNDTPIGLHDWTSHECFDFAKEQGIGNPVDVMRALGEYYDELNAQLKKDIDLLVTLNVIEFSDYCDEQGIDFTEASLEFYRLWSAGKRVQA